MTGCEYNDVRARALKDVKPSEELLRMIDCLARCPDMCNKIMAIKAIRAALKCSLSAGVHLYNEVAQNGLINFKEAK